MTDEGMRGLVLMNQWFGIATEQGCGRLWKTSKLSRNLPVCESDGVGIDESMVWDLRSKIWEIIMCLIGFPLLLGCISLSGLRHFSYPSCVFDGLSSNGKTTVTGCFEETHIFEAKA